MIQYTSNILGPLIFAAGRGQCIAMCNTRRILVFPESLTSGQLYYSDVMILFDLYIIFLTIPKALKAQHYFCLIYIEI